MRWLRRLLSIPGAPYGRPECTWRACPSPEWCAPGNLCDDPKDPRRNVDEEVARAARNLWVAQGQPAGTALFDQLSPKDRVALTNQAKAFRVMLELVQARR